MSFLSALENDFKRLFGKGPSVIQKVKSVISYAGPVVTLVATETAGAEYGAEVKNIVGEAESSLGTASAVMTEAGSSPSSTGLATVATALNAFNTNLSALLTAGHIKNADTVAKVTAIVGEVSAVVNSLVPAS